MTSLRSLIESAHAELPPPPLARWASAFFSLSVLTFVISLAASQTFLAAACILYGIHLLRTRTVPAFPPVKLPVALFCVFTILSIFWAENHAVGWIVAKKLVLFLILMLTVSLVTSFRHLRWLLQGVFLESVVVSIVAAVQFVQEYQIGKALHPAQVYAYMRQARIHGLMGHWMNFGGQQMLVFAVLAAFLLLALHTRKIWWLAGTIVASSIILNFSRGIWLGAFVGCVYLVARWRPLWLIIIPVLMIVGYLASPNLIRQRIESVRHPMADPSLAIRFQMWRVGWRMIQAHPLVGVGPDNIPETYTLYLPPGETPIVGYREHLHDNFIQLAAERGVPCLLAWLWMMVTFGWQILRVRRQLTANGVAARLWVSDAAFAGLLAFLIEGFFEFNFGTSPVLMVFLFVVATPFVAERTEQQPIRTPVEKK